MKAVLFKSPLEYSLVVEGENWRQGEPIKGLIKVKNHAQDAQSLQGLSVKLVHASLKDVRARKVDKVKILLSRDFLDAKTVAGSNGGDPQWEWSFDGDVNAPVTDSLSSLYVFFGKGEDLSQYGNIQVIMHPHALVGEVLTLLTIHHRFVLKAIKNQKGFVELKLDPPDERRFAAVDQALMRFRFQDDELYIHSDFAVTRIDGEKSSVGIAKKKETIKHELARHQYVLSNGRLNEPEIEKVLQEIYQTLGVGTTLGVVGKVL